MTNYYDPQRYALPGPQVEPDAAHWTYHGKRIEVVDVHRAHPFNIPDPYDTNPGLLENDVQELAYLAGLRASEGAIEGDFQAIPAGKPYDVSDEVDRRRKRLARYFYLTPPPITAQFNTANWQVAGQPPVRPVKDVTKPCEPGEPIVRRGQELARMFQDETPGLLHRHALNCLLFERPGASPPRQARIWMALDIAIYSALAAAWHIKWGHRDRPNDSEEQGSPDYTRVYRERPIAWELRVAEAEQRAPRFEVLFDYRLNPDGTEHGARRCRDEFVSPGTPRHPAYPSGHSTYSAAASKVLAHFFPDEEEELLILADNIGVARLWAGVHWRNDHTAGQDLGFWVTDQVIEQLCADPVRPLPSRAPDPCDGSIATPAFEAVEQFKQYRRDHPTCEPNHDTVPKAPAAASILDFQSQRGAVSP